MNIIESHRPGPIRAAVLPVLIAVLFIIGSNPAQAQGKALIDIARQSIIQVPAGMTSLNMSIYGVTLNMPWGEARNILDRSNVPYIFQKGTSPIVYIGPQNSTYYFILNPSSYAVIEMGIIGTAELPLDNQYMYDGHRWRLTTARTQFFGDEGEYIVNEEGEAYNYPFHGFVLKYLSPDNFRFVMVTPTNQPLTSYGRQLRPQVTETQPQTAPPPPPADPLEKWLRKFQTARNNFEARKYNTALGTFREISEQAPDALLKIRAVYWMGESYFGMKQYSSSKKQFERVLRNTDIESLRTPAQKMIGRCETNM